MKFRWAWGAVLGLSLLGAPLRASEGEKTVERGDPPDLRLADFFSTGWRDAFAEHPDEGRAPRFSLFKSRQGFLERVALFKAQETRGLEKRSTDEHEQAIEIEYALNRRFELDFEAFHVRQHPVLDEGRSGEDARYLLGARFALVDTKWCAYTFEPRITTRSSLLGDDRAILDLSLAGFHDLTKCGLYRTGLYTTLEYVDRHGRGPVVDPAVAEPELATSKELVYGLTLAKTFDPDRGEKSLELTLFAEALADHQIDGTRKNQTDVTITPGIRLAPWRDGRNWLEFGVELPVTDNRSLDRRYLVTFLKDF